MKYILGIILLFSFSNAAEKKQEVTVGAGPYIQTQPYKEVSPILLPSPVIFFDNSLFYVRWSRWGVYFLGDKTEDLSWGLSLTMQPRPLGYKASDSDFLEGMQERKNTLEGGVALSAAYDDAFLEVMLLTDMLGRHDSWLIRSELGKKYILGDFSLYPSLLLIYQSESFNDYYYGVKSSEVDLNIGRNFYKANAGLQLGMQTFINYKIDKQWSILTNIRIDRLPDEVKESPLLDEAYIYSGLLSLMYSFEY
jgi:outer membrane protein